jgi:hypothetical protein
MNESTYLGERERAHKREKEEDEEDKKDKITLRGK